MEDTTAPRGDPTMAMGNNVGRVDHVVMMCRPENLDAATRQLSELLEIEFVPFDAPRQGIRGALSIEGMLEFIAPRGDGSPASASLERLIEERGEGIHSITFGVADAQATHDRLVAQGYRTRPVYDAINEDTPGFVREAFSVTKEVHMRERIAGSLFVLSEIVPRDPTSS